MAVRVNEPYFACGDWYAYHGDGGKLLCSICASPSVCERRPELVAERRQRAHEEFFWEYEFCNTSNLLDWAQEQWQSIRKEAESENRTDYTCSLTVYRRQVNSNDFLSWPPPRERKKLKKPYNHHKTPTGKAWKNYSTNTCSSILRSLSKSLYKTIKPNREMST